MQGAVGNGDHVVSFPKCKCNVLENGNLGFFVFHHFVFTIFGGQDSRGEERKQESKKARKKERNG
jgi:hypothetical protein